MEISEIYQEHKHSVYRLTLTWLRSVSEAEDTEPFLSYNQKMIALRNKNRFLSGKK